MAKKTHGLSDSRLYNIWRHIKKRTRLETSANYKYYGGRGIKMCDEWYDSFEVFSKWSFENGYASNLSIDRKNVDGNYEPDNCRWTTQDVQMKNRRNRLAIVKQNNEEECPF